MIDGDGYSENYEGIREAVRLIKNVPGATVEIGVRRGYGSVNIMETCINNGDQRIHIAIDPYGGLSYITPDGIADFVYANKMKRECIADMYSWCTTRNQELFFFSMEDTEFFQRFSDGVPYYSNGKKTLINRYSLVMLDGVHTQQAVQKQVDFFISRISTGGIIICDNLDWYNHAPIEHSMFDGGFTVFKRLPHNKAVIYQKEIK